MALHDAMTEQQRNCLQALLVNIDTTTPHQMKIALISVISPIHRRFNPCWSISAQAAL